MKSSLGWNWVGDTQREEGGKEVTQFSDYRSLTIPSVYDNL